MTINNNYIRFQLRTPVKKKYFYWSVVYILVYKKTIEISKSPVLVDYAKFILTLGLCSIKLII